MVAIRHVHAAGADQGGEEHLASEQRVHFLDEAQPHVRVVASLGEVMGVGVGVGVGVGCWRIV